MKSWLNALISASVLLVIPTISVKPEIEMNSKVENIQGDSLELIPSPSPSVNIQIIGGKVYLR